MPANTLAGANNIDILYMRHKKIALINNFLGQLLFYIDPILLTFSVHNQSWLNYKIILKYSHTEEKKLLNSFIVLFCFF